MGVLFSFKYFCYEKYITQFRKVCSRSPRFPLCFHNERTWVARYHGNLSNSQTRKGGKLTKLMNCLFSVVP